MQRWGGQSAVVLRRGIHRLGLLFKPFPITDQGVALNEGDSSFHRDELTGYKQSRGAVRKLVSEKAAFTLLLLTRYPAQIYRI